MDHSGVNNIFCILEWSWCLSPVVVKVQEDKSASHLQVVNPLDEVVLKTEREMW